MSWSAWTWEPHWRQGKLGGHRGQSYPRCFRIRANIKHAWGHVHIRREVSGRRRGWNKKHQPLTCHKGHFSPFLLFTSFIRASADHNPRRYNPECHDLKCWNLKKLRALIPKITKLTTANVKILGSSVPIGKEQRLYKKGTKSNSEDKTGAFLAVQRGASCWAKWILRKLVKH